jgi:hypothetical protein
MRMREELVVHYGNGHIATFARHQNVTVLTRHRDGDITIRALVSVEVPRGDDILWKRAKVSSTMLEPSPGKATRGKACKA